MLNHITILGRFVRDPEVRQLKDNRDMASFTLACERDHTNPDGVRPADFIDFVAFGGAARFVEKYFHKGSMAVVSGRLQINEWIDNDGNKRRSASIVVASIYFGESKKSDSDKAEKPRYQSNSSTYGAFSDYDDDDDCPF